MNAPLAKTASRDARFVSAVLRRRARWLRKMLQPKTRQAVRFLPVLLQGSFRYPQLKGEAPGVRDMGFRPGWGALANGFGLPPPFAMQRSRALIESILVLPQEAGAAGAACDRALAVVLHNAERAEDHLLVEERLLAITGLLERAGLKLFSLPVREAQSHAVLLRRAVAFGAMIVGNLPQIAIDAADTVELDSRALAAHAPAPLAAIALLLLGGDHVSSPVQSLLEAKARGSSAVQLADPAKFAVEWTARLSGAGPLLRAALKLVDGEANELDLAAILSLCERLWTRLARATRTAPALRAELLGPGAPRALLPAIGKRLPPGRIELHSEGKTWIALVGTAPVARGGTRALALARALALVGQARQAAALVEPHWQPFAVELAKGTPFTALSIGSRNLPGPPFDPLNRGPSRELCIANAMLVRARPGRRPTATSLPELQAVQRLCESSLRKERVEIFAQSPDAQPAAMRLSRMLGVLSSETAAACEAGGQILFSRGSRLHRVSPRNFLSRPRLLPVDPEAPDLAFSPDRPQDVRAAAAVVQCRVELQGERAFLLFEDGRGARFSEQVPLSELEAYLEETQQVLRAITPSCALAVRAGHDVEQAVRTFTAPPKLATVNIAGTRPGPITLEIAGRNFSGAGDAAAMQIASSWPVGKLGRVSIKFQPGKADPMLALYTRSSVRRRLQARLDRIAL
jgi:hypothetical protein